MAERENIGEGTGIFYFMFVCVRRKKILILLFDILVLRCYQDLYHEMSSRPLIIRVKSSEMQPGLEIYSCESSV